MIWLWIIRWRAVWTSVARSRSRRGRSACRNYSGDGFAGGDGLSCRNYGRFAMIGGRKLLAILRCRLLVLYLRSHGRNALLPFGGHFGG